MTAATGNQLARGWQWAKSNQERIARLLKPLIFIGFTFFLMADEAFGAVYGYDNEAACWADTRYAETQGTGAAESFNTEFGLIADNNYDFYSFSYKAHQCFQVKPSLKQFVTINNIIHVGEHSITVTGSGLSLLANKLVALAVTVSGWLGSDFMLEELDIDGPSDWTIVGPAHSATEAALRDPCILLSKTRDPAASARAIAACQRENPPRDELPDSERRKASNPPPDHPAHPDYSSSTTEPVPTLSEALANARDRFANGDYSDDPDPVGKAIRVEYGRIQKMMNEGGYGAADKKKFEQLLEDIAAVLGAHYAAQGMRHEDEPGPIRPVWPNWPVLPGND